MLAARYIPNSVRFPVLATPKLDGIRCIKLGGRALTRSFKPVANIFARDWIETNVPDGCDGEIMLKHGNFSDISSGIGRHHGHPDFLFCAFDFVVDPTEPYFQRVKSLEGLPNADRMEKVLPALIHNHDDLSKYEQFCVSRGFEGIMVRDPMGPYKCGRSTEREGWLFKVKRFEDSEGVVIDTYEGLSNQNAPTLDAFGRTKRSVAGAGMVRRGELGGFIVRAIDTGVEFRLAYNHVAGGLDREIAWRHRTWLVGRIVKFSHQPSGAKDAPRFPQFIGWRAACDTELNYEMPTLRKKAA
jgi:DNA ligase-1